MREISKNFSHAGGRKYFSSKCGSLLHNAGDLTRLQFASVFYHDLFIKSHARA